MKSRYFLILTLLFVIPIVISGCGRNNTQTTVTTISDAGKESGTTTITIFNSGNNLQGIAQGVNHVVEFTELGFNPGSINIKEGDGVTFINKAQQEAWPASAKHPTHNVYPGSGIEKCNTAEQPKIFDACHGLKKGESWSFTFNEKGKWGYHDHITPTFSGIINVD